MSGEAQKYRRNFTSYNSVETKTSCMQAKEDASRDILAVKDAHIAALCTELRGKDRMLQAKTRVCTPPYYAVIILSGWMDGKCVFMHIIFIYCYM